MRYATIDDRYVVLGDDGAALLDDAPWSGGNNTGEVVEARGFGVPVRPSKIVCIGRNYAAHAAELGNEVPKEPLLFLKPPSALVGDGGTVRIPTASERVEHEVELAVVVGPDATIFGHTIAIDVTARDLQRSDKTWTRGKGFDTFCPVGPLVVTGLDDSALPIRCSVNGELRQDGCSDAMIHRPEALLRYIHGVMTLVPGDLVLTGTPAGVGRLTRGDRVVATVGDILKLSVDVQ